MPRLFFAVHEQQHSIVQQQQHSIVQQQVKKPTPPTKLLVEWVFLAVQQRLFSPFNERSFMNVFFWALHEQNRLPRASFYSFMNSCMALFVNMRSFPVDEHPQIRWRTISGIDRYLIPAKHRGRINYTCILKPRRMPIFMHTEA